MKVFKVTPKNTGVYISRDQNFDRKEKNNEHSITQEFGQDMPKYADFSRYSLYNSQVSFGKKDPDKYDGEFDDILKKRDPKAKLEKILKKYGPEVRDKNDIRQKSKCTSQDKQRKVSKRLSRN